MIERVRALQREIVLIEQDTRAYFGCRKPSKERTLLQQRRVERLTEIKNELGRLLQKSAASKRVATRTTKPEGTSMGLAISRSIAESHGDRLWATANDGRGATFHLTAAEEGFQVDR